MALVERPRPPSPWKVRPLPTLLAAVACSASFIVGLALVARGTADGVRMPQPVVVDAGVVADAGVVSPVYDGGTEPVTVSPDGGLPVDGGPPMVPGPPFPPEDVVATAVVVVQRCVGEALRWDPSLGGPFTLEVDLAPVVVEGGVPRLRTPGLSSPVLSACLDRRAAEVELPALDLDGVGLMIVARAALDAGGRITWSDANVTPSPMENRKPPRCPE